MTFNSLGQYNGNFKPWDHVGNIVPDVELSEGERPACEFKPAAWLPVQFYDKYYENWNVIMPGKIVALDNDGRVVPAQYGLASAQITYTSDDVNAGVTDCRTGVALLTANIGTFNVSSVTAFNGVASVTLTPSKPIGVCPYPVLQWAGGDGFNPANYRQHNYNMQHQIAVLCDYVLQLPLVPAAQASTSLAFGVPSSNLSTSSAVGNLPVATNTVGRTPISFTGGSSTTLFINQVPTLALVLAAGDWFINYTTGVVTVYATSQPSSINISYYHYAANATTVSKFSCVVGNPKPGDFLICDVNSNFKVRSTEQFDDIMGQVLVRDAAFPKDAMDRVRTAFNPPIGTTGTGALPGYLGQLDQMPGSANGGVPANISYAGAADTMCYINLVSR